MEKILCDFYRMFINIFYLLYYIFKNLISKYKTNKMIIPFHYKLIYINKTNLFDLLYF